MSFLCRYLIDQFLFVTLIHFLSLVFSRKRWQVVWLDESSFSRTDMSHSINFIRGLINVISMFHLRYSLSGFFSRISIILLSVSNLNGRSSWIHTSSSRHLIYIAVVLLLLQLLRIYTTDNWFLVNKSPLNETIP